MNNCTQPTVTGAGLGPCATVAAGVTKAGASGTVHVDGGDNFSEGVILPTGVSLLGDNFQAADSGAAVLDGGTGSAVFVPLGESAGSIRNLTLRGNDFALAASGQVGPIAQNRFDDPTAGSDGVVLFNGVTAQVTGNTFVGDGASAQVAVSLGDGSSTVSGNTIGGYWLGIAVSGSSVTSATSTPTVLGNALTGIHQQTSQGGAGIFSTSGANPLIEGNSVSAAGTGVSSAIFVSGSTAPASTGATLRRNRVSGGYNNGITLKDTVLPTSSTSDVVTGSTSAGYEIGDQASDEAGVGDIALINATVWGNSPDITTLQNVLTLDSSVVEDPITSSAATCAVTFSRGPTTSPGGNGCANFQTTATPGFVNAAGGDFHLTAASPMIEAGNPAAPAAGALDFEGEPRAIDSTPICPLAPRRDIGADEFFAVQPSCPPNVPIGPIVKKKCKKPKKLKKGKCVGKKKRKKK